MPSQTQPIRWMNTIYNVSIFHLPFCGTHIHITSLILYWLKAHSPACLPTELQIKRVDVFILNYTQTNEFFMDYYYPSYWIERAQLQSTVYVKCDLLFTNIYWINIFIISSSAIIKWFDDESRSMFYNETLQIQSISAISSGFRSTRTAWTVKLFILISQKLFLSPWNFYFICFHDTGTWCSTKNEMYTHIQSIMEIERWLMPG